MLTKLDTQFGNTYKKINKSLGLVEPYRLEGLDPWHRPASFLNLKYFEWEESNSEDDFFDWLGYEGAGSGIDYYKGEKANQFLYTPTNLGLLNNKQQPLVTTNYGGKQPGYALYVIDRRGHLFCHPHEKGKVHHSSLVAGKKVLAAGMIKTNHTGQIVDINNRTGHYQSNLLTLYLGIQAIPKTVFAPRGTVSYQEPFFPNLVTHFSQSRYSIIRWLGRVFDNFRTTKTVPYNQFEHWAEQELLLQKYSQAFIDKQKSKASRLLKNQATTIPSIHSIEKPFTALRKPVESPQSGITQPTYDSDDLTQEPMGIVYK